MTAKIINWRGAFTHTGRRAYTLLLLAVVFTALFTSAEASLVFETERVQLKGQFGQEELHASYPFVNRGERPVTVTEIKSGCGCTVPELEQRVYAPGEAGVVRAVFTVGQRQGEQRQTITVQTDQGTHTLRLIVDLPQRLQISPRIVIFSKAQPAEVLAQLTFAEDLPARIEQIVVSDADFTADYEWVTQAEPSIKERKLQEGSIEQQKGSVEAQGDVSSASTAQICQMRVRYIGPPEAEKRALVQIRSVGKSGKEYVDYLHLRKIP